MRRLPGIGAEHAQAAHQHGHLGCREREQVCPVNQQELSCPSGPLTQVIAKAISRRLKHGERLHIRLVL